MTRLSSDYIRGYSDALMDVRNQLFSDGLRIDMKLHKVSFNRKSTSEVLHLMIANRALFREHPDDYFIRCKKDGGFEVAKAERA